MIQTELLYGGILCVINHSSYRSGVILRSGKFLFYTEPPMEQYSKVGLQIFSDPIGRHGKLIEVLVGLLVGGYIGGVFK